MFKLNPLCVTLDERETIVIIMISSSENVNAN